MDPQKRDKDLLHCSGVGEQLTPECDPRSLKDYRNGIQSKLEEILLTNDNLICQTTTIASHVPFRGKIPIRSCLFLPRTHWTFFFLRFFCTIYCFPFFIHNNSDLWKLYKQNQEDIWILLQSRRVLKDTVPSTEYRVRFLPSHNEIMAIE